MKKKIEPYPVSHFQAGITSINIPCSEIVSSSSLVMTIIFCINEMFTGIGNTAEAAKLDMRQQMDFFKKTAIEDSFSYPDFLNEDFEIVYKFDTESLLEYYSGILSLSGLEKITGIHQKQLWNYLHRKSKPRRAQVEKIEKGLHALGSDIQYYRRLKRDCFVNEL